MYAWLWRILPGPMWLKIVLCLLLVVAVVAVCFTWVFPAVAPHLPFNDGTVSGSDG